MTTHAPTRARAAAFHAIDREGARRRALTYAVLSPVLVTVGLTAMLAQSAVPAGSIRDRATGWVILAVWAVLLVEFLVRLWSAPEAADVRHETPLRARLIYLGSIHGFIDFVATIALPVAWIVGLDNRDGDLLATIWALKYFRHSTGLSLLVRVALRSRAALFSVATVFSVAFLLASTLAYVFERKAQPEAFASVPKAMWWAIVTLTTTGYGDVVPSTIWGRLLAGWVMVSGIAIFALWAGIIANAFTEELRRRDFLRTWDLVAQVPFFSGLGAAAIADVVRLLQPRDVAHGTVLFREGQPGDSMFFIVTGEATVQIAPKPIVLGPGSFVGEMALLFGAPRSATVVVTEPSLLLVLDIANFRELAGRRPELVTVIEAEGKRRRDANLAATH
jgi:voltage-gated potassium channel